MNLKRDIKWELSQNTKSDKIRYDEMLSDIDLLQKADADTLSKIDGLDKKYATSSALQKANSDIKLKFDTFEKKQQLLVANNNTVIEEINCKIKAIEGKQEDLKKLVDALKAENKDKFAKFDFKLIDT